MKNSLILYVIFATLFIVTSCSLDELHKEQKQVSLEQKRNQTILPIRSKTELIVSFKRETPEKIKKWLRTKYKVKYFERCNCSNHRIEKWIFGNDTNVEERMGDIAQETEVEGTDFQYYHVNKDKNTDVVINTMSNPSLKPFMNLNTNGVKIAVLDTGINLHILGEKAPFLYHSEEYKKCKENGYKEVSGWDFVNNDNDPYDELGHGTIVTDRILNELGKEFSGNYSILPVKVFNHLGKGNTFDILCGYLFAVNKGDIDIINMSFGWYGAPSQLLDLYISQNNHIIHITSAGNSNSNNDKLSHFPSSISYNNVLAIGSYSMKENNLYTIKKSNFSNYGIHTVDYLAEGENIFFQDINNNYYPIEGTSYAAPLVTGKIAKNIANYGTGATDILYKLWNNATGCPRNTLPVYYYDRIIK